MSIDRYSHHIPKVVWRKGRKGRGPAQWIAYVSKLDLPNVLRTETISNLPASHQQTTITPQQPTGCLSPFMFTHFPHSRICATSTRVNRCAVVYVLDRRRHSLGPLTQLRLVILMC